MHAPVKLKSKLTPHTIIFIFIIAVSLITWLIPGGKFENGEFVSTGTDNAAGIYDIIAAPVQGFFEAADIILFIFVMGIFISVVMDTGALQAGIQKLATKLKGKERILIVILTILFGLGGTTFGLCEETVAFYGIVAAVCLAAKLDVAVTILVVFCGSSIGVLASTINPFAIGAAVESAGIDGIFIYSGIIHRIVLFVLLETVLIIFILKYIKKIESNPALSVVADMKEIHEKQFDTVNEDYKFTAKRAMIIGMFAFTFFILCVSIIPWPEFDYIPFGDLFINFHDSVANSFLGKLIGLDATTSVNYWANDTSNAAFGDWWFGQLTVWFFFMAVVIACIHGFKNPEYGEKEMLESCGSGIRNMVSIAFLCAIARGIEITLSNTGMDATLLHHTSNLLKDVSNPIFGVLLYWLYIPLALVISSTSGLANATMPIVAPLSETVLGTGGTTLAILAFTMGSGLANLVTPTCFSIVACSILNIPYTRYVKLILPLLTIIFTICTIYIAVLAAFI